MSKHVGSIQKYKTSKVSKTFEVLLLKDNHEKLALSKKHQAYVDEK